ncbi:hypothetical protein [Sphaerotilus montanus]|jgi:hypothetical protein|uniref:hypothetical protein n=1 Tax=Sphaerotilus montanus TaxID=522889 RepID=UPI003FA2E4EE
MSPDARTFLCDAIGATRLALSFVEGCSFEDYQTDPRDAALGGVVGLHNILAHVCRCRPSLG